MIHLRAATIEDGRFLMRLRNAPDVYKRCLSPRPVTHSEHFQWLRAKLGDPRTRIYILQDSRGSDVGQGRIDLRHKTAEISLALRASSRGRGLGRVAIASLARRAEQLGARRVIARINRDNSASTVAFIKAGFGFVRCFSADGEAFYLMEKTGA